jgi:hypothetical protein
MDERVVEFMKLIAPRIVANGGVFLEMEPENRDEKQWAYANQLLHIFTKEEFPQTKLHVQCSTFELLQDMDTGPSPALGVWGLHFPKKSKINRKKGLFLKFSG